MDRTRDLDRMDVLKGSLKRSFRRRARSPHTASMRSLMPLPVAGLAAVAAVAAAPAQASPAPAPIRVAPAKPGTHDSPLVGARAPAARYVNPLAHAHVAATRIDQGVDYFGTGTLTSIGWARIKQVHTTNSGWPGAFIEYRLIHGPRAGRYVYYAEGVTPAPGIYVGRLVRPGRAVARLIPGWSSGIEMGWGANIGTETLAARFRQYSYPTRCGRNFSAFIASLGGPPGHLGPSLEDAAHPFGRP